MDTVKQCSTIAICVSSKCTSARSAKHSSKAPSTLISNCKEIMIKNVIPRFALIGNVMSFLIYSLDLLLGDFLDQRLNLERVEEER